MEYEDYLKELESLKSDFNIKKTELAKSFAISNNKYKEGDIVTDHIGSILVDKISFYYDYQDKPSIIYSGIMLKKDGKPKKIKERRNVYQCNLI